MLLSDGHDVVSALEVDPRASDAELLEFARANQRVLITEDKDFGELVFVHRQLHSGVIRFTNMTVNEKALAMRQLLEHHAEAIEGQRFIVVTRNRIRIRRHA